MPAPKRRATSEEIDAALLILASNGGNAAKSHEIAGVPERTLQDWRNRYHERYQELRQRHKREIEDKLIEEHRENAILSAQLQRKATMQALDDKQPFKDPARVAREASIASGVAIDKLLVLDGRPTQITQNTDAVQALGEMARRLGISYDSTADEIPPGELPPPSAA
jgi:hypothetical protein